MIAVRLLWLAVLLVAIPAWVGNCFLNVDKPCRNPVFLWISGQMLLWAGFQVICVPVILLEGRMWMVTVAYCGYILVLLAAATVRYFRQSRTLRAVREAKPEKAEIILWVLAGVLLLVQLVLAVLMVYGDGDDAYYVAISAAAEESGRMYQKIPYTGMHTELDVRHGLAPFPIWIAWLAQMTGITTVIVAKTLVPRRRCPRLQQPFDRNDRLLRSVVAAARRRRPLVYRFNPNQTKCQPCGRTGASAAGLFTQTAAETETYSQSITWIRLGNIVRLCFMVIEISVRTSQICRI